MRARRLARHSLLERAGPERLVEVIGAVCGIHAQVMASAELSIGVRVGVTKEDVRAALWERRVLVKAQGIRGTIHLFPAQELAFWTAALGAHPNSGERHRLAEFGLDRAQVDAIAEVVGEALDGRTLTQRELGEEVVRRLGAWAGEETVAVWGGTWPRWRIALGYAATAGLLCWGPNAGNEVTYVRPDQWLPPAAPVDPREALREVLRRYLRAYGPATARDFGQWFGLEAAAASALAAELGEELAEVDVEGYRCLELAADSASSPTESGRSVRLLPHFDCYLRGFFPRQQLAGGWAEPAAGGTGQLPVLLVDGAVAGIWERHARRRQVDVRVQAFRPLQRAQRRVLEEEAARVGEILGLEAALTFGEVSARPHL